MSGGWPLCPVAVESSQQILGQKVNWQVHSKPKAVSAIVGWAVVSTETTVHTCATWWHLGGPHEDCLGGVSKSGGGLCPPMLGLQDGDE